MTAERSPLTSVIETCVCLCVYVVKGINLTTSESADGSFLSKASKVTLAPAPPDAKNKLEEKLHKALATC